MMQYSSIKESDCKNIFRLAMKPKKVSTPGSYQLDSPSAKCTPPRKKLARGRPGAEKRKRTRLGIKHRAQYTEADITEAVRLVTEENYTIKAAALEINSMKKNIVPRMTLSDRLKSKFPDQAPALGRPQELSKAVEEALVKCLEICASYNYPMRKRDLQDLVQAYCLEHSVNTRWKDNRPGKQWIRHFRRRWAHRVKIRKPTNIKRSRAAVSPQQVKDFCLRMGPNLEGVSRYNIFNYDESPFQDNPAAEDAFCGGGTKYFEVIQNHSKTTFSVMFCCAASGDMLPPMVVYQCPTGSLFQTWCEGGPEGTVYSSTRNGWFDMERFNQWFKEVCSILHLCYGTSVWYLYHISKSY
jgi:hypothetical protein